MGWEISRRITKKGIKQFRVWSNNTDSWHTAWSSGKEILQYITEDALYSYKQRVIEIYYRFPHHFGDHDEKGVKIILDEEARKNWEDWMKRLLSVKDEDYYKTIDLEFDKIIKELEL